MRIDVVRCLVPFWERRKFDRALKWSGFGADFSHSRAKGKRCAGRSECNSSQRGLEKRASSHTVTVSHCTSVVQWPDSTGARSSADRFICIERFPPEQIMTWKPKNNERDPTSPCGAASRGDPVSVVFDRRTRL